MSWLLDEAREMEERANAIMEKRRAATQAERVLAGGEAFTVAETTAEAKRILAAGAGVVVGPAAAALTISADLPVGDAILGPDGPLARTLPGYEPRRPQIRMANLVEEVIANGTEMQLGLDEDDADPTTCATALIEAGTGTGKSLAYLIPAILSGEKVVVSTDTIQLQEQLVGKDLPFLQKVLGRPFSFAIAKGRGNYLCPRNARSLADELAGTFLREDRDDLLFNDVTSALEAFEKPADAPGAWDGDKSSLRLPIPDARWSALAGDDTCTGKDCPCAAECPHLAKKAQVENADIVITNHTMYLLHHYLSEIGAQILPAHSVWIADEAHTLPDKACDVFGMEISHVRPASIVKRLQRQAKALGLKLEPAPGETREPIDYRAIIAASDSLFRLFWGATEEQQRIDAFEPEIVERARDATDKLETTLRPVRLALHAAATELDPERDRSKLRAIDSLKRSISSLIEYLRATLDPEPDPDYVAYAEVSAELGGRPGKRVTLHRKPIETAPIFRGILETLRSAVFCSATLAVGGRDSSSAWETPTRDLGLDPRSRRLLRVDSPFDYARQVTAYLPPNLPEARHPAYLTELTGAVAEILERTQGRAFVLFTSTRDMKASCELLRSMVRFPVLLQGEKPKGALVDEFLSTPNSVLVATKTFWTGVDIPGERLSCVILAKLPFPQQGHPLNDARCRKIEERGGRSFMEFSLPRCIQDVRQGFGRLIRTSADTGVFAILDPRVRTARYGSLITGSLPAMKWEHLPEAEW